MEGAVRVVDQFVREQDGSVTRVQWIGSEPISVDRNYPVILLDPKLSWVLQERWEQH